MTVICTGIEFDIKRFLLSFKNWHAWDLVHAGYLINICCIKERESEASHSGNYSLY